MMGNHEEINIPTTVPATGTFKVQALAPETAAKASEILQNNHNNYHIYIHNLGLHSKKKSFTLVVEYLLTVSGQTIFSIIYLPSMR